MMILFLCLIFVIPSHASIWDTLNATIITVEYLPLTDGASTSQERVLLNAKEYARDVQTLAETIDIDLIIFPEATVRDNPETASLVEIGTTCSDETTQCSDLLKQIATAARDHQTYITINIVEKSQCENSDESENCKNFGFRFYNTNVFFARNGTIIQKYRKYNLFGEYDLDQPINPDQVIIETDFGVKFGTFTCFDLLFKSPAQDLLTQNIDGIIFPTMWFSELPFLTAVQAQQMFAYTHDVTFFSAGANNPQVGSGGSAVFRGAKGAILRGIVAEGGTKFFQYHSENGVVIVPPLDSEDVDKLAKEMDNFLLKIDDSILDLNSTLLDITKPSFSGEICYNGVLPENQLCCTFDITMSLTTPNPELHSYTYHLVAFSGIRTFTGVYNGGIELCGLIACLNSSLSSCGQRFPKYDDVEWPITFEEIQVTAKFEKNENKTQYPNSLLSSILPIDASKTSWSRQEDDNIVTRVYSTKESQNRILTFGIYGRNFGQDSPPGTGSGNSSLEIVPRFLIVCFLTLSLLIK